MSEGVQDNEEGYLVYSKEEQYVWCIILSYEI